MKNIQVIDGAENCVYDVFAATDEEFATIFPEGQDIAFIEDLFPGPNGEALQGALSNLWKRRVPKVEVLGIHGTLFYELLNKKKYYPTLKDEEAVNPSGSALR